MFSRAVLLLLLSYVVLCLAEKTTQAPTVIKTTMSVPAILITVMFCVSAPVLIVLIPTLLYYKFCGKSLKDEIV